MVQRMINSEQCFAFFKAQKTFAVIYLASLTANEIILDSLCYFIAHRIINLDIFISVF